MKNILLQIKYFFESVKHRIAHFLERIWQCWVYSKYVFRSYDWDWTYLLEIMEIKLKMMERNFRLYGHLESNEQNCKDINHCISLLRNLRKDEYFDGELSNIHIDKKNNVIVEDEYINKIRHYYKLANEQRDKDLTDFCEIFKTRLFHWWD